MNRDASAATRRVERRANAPVVDGAAARDHRDRVMTAAAYAYLIVTVLLAVGTAFYSSAQPGVYVVAVIGVTALVALFVAPRVNGARRLTPWTLLALAAVAFGARILFRPHELEPAAALPLPATLAAIVGYMLVLASALSFLKDHHDQDRGSLADSLVLASGAVAPVLVFLIAPAMRSTGETDFNSIVAGLFPLFDLMLCYLLARLTLSMPAKPPAMKLILLSALMVLIGDLGWALVAAGFVEAPVATLDIPYTFSFVTIAAASLHPSMRELTVPTVRRIGPLRSGRFTVVAAALAAPAVVVAVTDLDSQLLRLAVAASIATGALIAAQRARRAVEQHAENEERLAFMATHDVLTGLPNRLLALERIEMGLAGEESRGRVAALFIDVDRFKLINDTWGHPVGDELLIAIGRRLRRRIDRRVLVARMSGDEFLLVATAAQPGYAESLAEQVLVAFHEPVALSNGDVIATVSVGIAVAHATPGSVTPHDLVRDADIALYRAKTGGRNRYEVFDNSMHRSLIERYSLERDLRLAVERGEFTVHYQPIVDIASGNVMGFEALLRWDRPGHGPVNPDEFVPVLEDLDLIVDVGEFVLRRALTQLALWQRAGLDVYVSINVAARQIHRGCLVTLVGQLLDESGVAPDRLLLELTESLLIEESPVVRETMDGLTLLGVHLAIDDFGTGHSSLQYLTRFPVSAVKVDRSFVQALGRDADSATIVQGVVGMSHALGMTVIAEGVETAAQRAHVARLGCDAVQGFTEGRPDEATRFVSTASADATMDSSITYAVAEKGTQA